LARVVTVWSIKSGNPAWGKVGRLYLGRYVVHNYVRTQRKNLRTPPQATAITIHYLSAILLQNYITAQCFG
jgi:hypothetical protein